MHSTNKSFLFCCILLLIGCNGIVKDNLNVPQKFHSIEFSKQFGILESANQQQLFYINGKDTNWSVVIKKNQIPLKITVLSTVFAGFIEVLQDQQNIVGIDNLKFYSDSLLLKQVKENKTSEVGEEGQVQIEKLMALHPDIIICNSSEFISSATGQRLSAMGIKILYCANFKEAHPLARAEWIKFFGAITNKLSIADSIFNTVKANYSNIVTKTQALKKEVHHYSPRVMTEAMFGDTWFVPGGSSYTAQLIKDAGGEYIFEDQLPLFTYPKSLEDVLVKAKNADVWINVNQYTRKEQLIKSDARFAMFKPFKENKIFNNNKRENSSGGNDFWEKGVCRPDLILNDLFIIFNTPNIETNKLYYYTRIE